jgi:MYXO-CTERM domain-containing protein
VRDPATKTWSLQGTFTAATGTAYGNEVELSGDRALVTVRSGLSPQGIAHIYERTGSTWSAGTELVPQGLTGSDAFGYAIALAGDQAFASAPAGDDFGDKSGRVHVFTNQAGAWSQTETFHSPAPAAGEAFGGSMAGDAMRVLVGTTWDTRAYVFELGAGSGGSGGSAGGGSGGSVAAGGSGGGAGTSSFGGTAGAIGTGGAAGSASGGTGATSAGGSGGSIAFGGAAGTGAQPAAASNDDGGGCGCRTPARGPTPSSRWFVLLAVLALGCARRRITG